MNFDKQYFTLKINKIKTPAKMKNFQSSWKGLLYTHPAQPPPPTRQSMF